MADFVFNLAQLMRAPSGSQRAYDVEAPRRALDLPELAGPVTGRVRLIRLPDAVHAAGEFAALVNQPCARCLEPVRKPLEFAVEEQYVSAFDLLTGQPIPPDDDRPRLDDRHNLDLTVLLTEGVITALPLMPLCRPDCPGVPGVQDSRDPAADAAPLDPRLEPLRRLRSRMFPQSGGIER